MQEDILLYSGHPREPRPDLARDWKIQSRLLKGYSGGVRPATVPSCVQQPSWTAKASCRACLQHITAWKLMPTRSAIKAKCFLYRLLDLPPKLTQAHVATSNACGNLSNFLGWGVLMLKLDISDCPHAGCHGAHCRSAHMVSDTALQPRVAVQDDYVPISFVLACADDHQ